MFPPQISKVEFTPPGPIQPGENLTVTAYIVNTPHAKVDAVAEIGSPVMLTIALNDSGQFPDAIPQDNNWTGSAKWNERTGASRGLPVAVTCRATMLDKTYKASKRAKKLLVVDSSSTAVDK
jgi:hypothetical protein